MGFNISYMATRVSAVELASNYRLELGPLEPEIPSRAKPFIVELSNGWTIWWSQEPDSFQLNKINPHLACKQGQHCYAVSVSEFCMHSSIAKYTPISKRWSVAHYGDEQGPEHLEITGKPPKIFAEIRDEVFQRQRNQIVDTVKDDAVPDELKAIAERIGGSVKPWGSRSVDYAFDIPMLLGRHFFDFIYGQVPEKGTILQCYEVLENTSAGPNKRNFWQRIVGR
jgi:hypothetical protein